jgi:hypothetical protein
MGSVGVILNLAGQPVRWRTPSARLAKGCGSTCIIGLNAIRRDTGEGWETLRERVTQQLETLLHQHLGPADFFVPVGDVSYLVVMPAAAPEDGLIGCLHIAYELHNGLFGSCPVDRLNIAEATAVTDDVLQMQALNRGELVQLAALAGLDFQPQHAGAELRNALTAPCRIGLRFQPVWDGQLQVIRAYRCLPQGLKRPPAGLSPAQLSREMLEASLAVLRLSVATLERHMARQERFPLYLPLSFEMLSAPVARMEFVAACRQLPCSLRPYLGFTLIDLPPGVPQSRLSDLTGAIRSFGGMIAARLPQRLSAIEAFRNTGIKALGTGLAGVPPAQYGAVIERLVAETRKLNLTAFLEDVPDAQVVRFAMERGVQWLSGAAIAAATDDPGPLQRLSVAELLREGAAA